MTEYIDRKSLGIAEIFAEMHPIFSPSSDLNAEETVRLLCEQARRTRHKVAMKINGGIHKITSDSTVDVEDYLDDDIRELARYPLNADSLNRLLPFMKWIMEIHRRNSLSIDRSRYALGDAANHMDRVTGDFVRSCTENAMWHSVSFTQEDGGILMSFQERFWGKASLFFPDVRTKFTGTFPLVGMLFCMEGEHRDGVFEFSCLVNVEFGTDDLELRALQDRNWVRLSFECSQPRLQLKTFDYGGALKDFGKRGHSFIEEWCKEALNKENTLGSASMSAKENDLLPLAKILRLSFQLADIEQGDDADAGASEGNLSQKVLETLGNRYRFHQFEKLLCDAGHEDLYKELKDAMEAWECDDFGETSRKVWDFARLLRQKERDDAVRVLYDGIMNMMCECTAEFTDKSRLYGTYADAEEKMRGIIEPHLLEKGFTGSYPHYRRRRGRKGEYISVLTSNVNKRTVNGVMTYFFSISAAVKKLEKRGRGKAAAYFAAGMPFEESTAEDCRSVYIRGTKYTELGGMYDDESAEINIDIFEGLSDEKVALDTAMVLNRFVDVALNGMKGRHMPRWYRKKRRQSVVKYKHETTLNGTFMKYLPFGLYLSVLLMGTYVVCDRFFTVADYLPQLTGSAAVVLSLLGGLMAALLGAVIKMRSLRKHMWRY